MAVERFPVEEGTIMLFARAIGDPNPIYSNRDHAAGTEVGTLIAPPTYVQSSAQFEPDHPLRPRLGEPWFGSLREVDGQPVADIAVSTRNQAGEAVLTGTATARLDP